MRADGSRPNEGRPTVATPEKIDKGWSYVNRCTDDGLLPTVEKLAYILDINTDTVYVRDEFSDILKKLRQLQADMLIQKGLKGQYNPTIAKLLLSSKHGYIEKSATDITTDGQSISPISSDMVAKFTEFIKGQAAENNKSN